jgi:AP-1 complex subunit beta-1
MSHYFSSSNKRGELSELNEDLNSLKWDKKKEAIKKVIAYMTIGKDVSTLFQSVIRCLELNDIEIIKLVYLYIINYSRTKPDDAIMVVQLFRKDCANKASPLIRALAVRTMGCIRVKKINEYLIEPLKEALADTDPYVKKTAVLCVPKVFEVSPELVETHGLIDTLVNMVQKEGNAFVVANLVACLQELSEMKGKSLLPLNFNTISKLLLALNDCVEWGQVFILDSILHYTPTDAKEAESIIDRVIPRLSHINPSVVMSSVKLIIKYMDYLTSVDSIKNLCRKVSPSLVSLLNTPPEIQYIVLRNINFLIEKRPQLLEKDIRVFFVKFNDPYYVKLEKLDILTKLCEARNFEVVINELNEYANEVDPEFSRKALKAIGRIALKVDKAADKCISVLKNIIGECKKSQHVVEESSIVFQVIYRKFPEKFIYDNTIKELCDSFSEIIESDPRGSLIWVIGEFSEKMEKSVDILNELTDSFLNESQFVQLQLLTATVKLFLKQPDVGDQLITKVLELASEKNENPDVRDRGYIYWRMLSSDTELAKKVVLSERPVINEDAVAFEPALLENLINNVSMVSSVFHKNAEVLIPKVVIAVAKRGPEEDEIDLSPSEVAEDAKEDGKKKDDKKDEPKSKYDEKPKKDDKKKVDIKAPGKDKKDKKEEPKPTADIDLLGLDTPSEPTKPDIQKQSSGGGIDLLDILGGSTSNSKSETISPQFSQPAQPEVFQNVVQIDSATPVPFEVILKENQGGTGGKSGLKLEGAFLRENQKIILGLKITNLTNAPITEFDAQIKPNYFGLKIDAFPSLSIAPNKPTEIKLLITNKGTPDSTAPATPLTLTVGLKCSLDVFYLNIPCMFHVLLEGTGELKADEFKKLWKDIPNTNELMFEMTDLNPAMKNVDAIKKALRKNNIFYLAARSSQAGSQIMYFTSKSIDGTHILSEVTLPSAKSPNGCSISCRCLISSLIPLFLQCSSFILKH